MPSEVIMDNTCGYASVKITDKSLLSGVTKIMALATSFAVQYTSKSESMSDKEKDKRFIFTSEAKKENTVDLYVNYTNNMVFNEDAEQYNLLKPFIFPSYRVSKYTTDHNEYQERCIHSWTEVDSHIEGTTVYHDIYCPKCKLEKTVTNKEWNKIQADMNYQKDVKK